jgi:hypothetical protein
MMVQDWRPHFSAKISHMLAKNVSENYGLFGHALSKMSITLGVGYRPEVLKLL